MTIGGVSRLGVPRRKQTNTEKNPEADQLKDVMKMFDDWWDYTKSLHDKWDRDLKLIDNVRVLRAFQGVSDTFIPMAFTTVETIKSAIVLGDLNVDYTPQDIYKWLEERVLRGKDFASDTERDSYLIEAINAILQEGFLDDTELRGLNALFDYYWDTGDWVLCLEDLVDSGLSIGNGAWWLTWDVNRPKLESVPFRDYIFDPTAVKDGNCRYVGRRYLKNLEDLKKVQILDPKERKIVDRYTGFGQLGNSKSATGENTDKQQLEQMLMGSTLGTKDGQVEVIEIVTPDRQFTIFNRKVLAEDRENITKTQAKLLKKDWDGILPGITWSNYRRSSLLIGKSEVEVFWREQERLNDLANQKSDSITRSLMQQKRIDPKLAHMSKMLDIPGAVIPASQGQIEVLGDNQVPFQAFREEDSIKGNIREATAIDQIVKGVGDDSNVTATEVKAQVASAGQRIEKKVKSLERGPLKQLALKTLLYVQLFNSTEKDRFIIPTSSSKGMKPVLFDPLKYGQMFVPHVQLKTDAMVQKRQEQAEARESYKILIQDETNNLEEIKRIYLPKMVDLDKSEVERIMTPNPEQANPMGAPMGNPEMAAV